MTDDTGRKPIVTSYIDLDMITHKPTKDALRRAAADAAHDPVWITEDGERIAAIVSPDAAEHLLAVLGFLGNITIEEITEKAPPVPESDGE